LRVWRFGVGVFQPETCPPKLEKTGSLVEQRGEAGDDVAERFGAGRFALRGEDVLLECAPSTSEEVLLE